MTAGPIGGHGVRTAATLGKSVTRNFGNASDHEREEGVRSGMAAVVDTAGMVVGAESCIHRTKLTLAGLPAWFEVCSECGQALVVQSDREKVRGCRASGNENSFLYVVEVDGFNLWNTVVHPPTYDEVCERAARGQVHESCKARGAPFLFSTPAAMPPSGAAASDSSSLPGQ